MWGIVIFLVIGAIVRGIYGFAEMTVDERITVMNWAVVLGGGTYGAYRIERATRPTRVRWREKRFFQAVDAGNLKAVRRFIRRRGSPTLRDEKGLPAVIRGIERQQLTVVRFLIAWTHNRKYSTALDALLWAIDHNSVTTVETLRECGLDLKQKGWMEEWYNRAPGMSPLCAAIEQEKWGIVQSLLRAGAEWDIESLQAAKVRGRPGLAEDLFRLPRNDTHFLWAVAVLADEGRIQTFLREGFDINAKDCDGNTLLHWVAAAERTDILPFLMNSGADFGATNEAGRTPLMESVTGLWPWKPSVETARALIRVTKDINRRDKEGNSALLLACKEDYSGYDGGRYLPVIECLIEAGADVNLPDMDGYTPLMAAARNSSGRTVRLLLRTGADVSAYNKYGETALTCFDADDDPEMFEFLKRVMSPKNPPDTTMGSQDGIR